MIRLVILDFDGVVLESVAVKTEAFRALFSSVPEHVDEIVRFHVENGGMSRFDKLRHIYKNILHEDLTPEKSDELAAAFASLVLRGVLAAPFVPGARKFLSAGHARIPLYVVSATPEDELHRIIRERGIDHCFRKTYGSPRIKIDCIRDILAAEACPPAEALFVGDAGNDLEAARAAGIRFIGRVCEGDRNPFAGQPGVDAVITGLSELERYIRETP